MSWTGVVGLAAGLVATILPAAPVADARPPVSDGARAPMQASPPAAWTTYHYDNARSGYDPNQPTFSSAAPAWTSGQLDGNIYAEPLVLGGTVYVATENDTVYALDIGTGAVQWSLHLDSPQAASGLPCGNISPVVGITGTPVIDPVANVLYAAGMISTGHYRLWAVDLGTHALKYAAVAIDPPNSDPLAEGQRGALGLSGGRVYVPYGGRWGDCGTYHGGVVGVNASDGGGFVSAMLSADRGGIWAPGGLSIDGNGSVYVATGNTGCPSTFDFNDSVLKLSADLATLQSYWAPSNWHYLTCNDIDVGSISPGLVGGYVIQSGKSGDVYLLNQSSLGGMGGEVFAAHVCGVSSDASFGSTAYIAPYIYVPCVDGLYALTLGSSSFSTAWSETGYDSGPPIVAGSVVWNIGGGTLRAHSLSGTPLASFSIGSTNRFSTPAAGGGYVFAADWTHVHAFTLAPCSSVGLAASPASPQPAGSNPTFTASSSCASPEYRFFLQTPGSSTWTMTRDYNSTPSWQWLNGGVASGTYHIAVWVRQTGSLNAYDAYTSIPFTIPACASATIGAMPASPQAPGTAVTVTAGAGGCGQPTFRFFVQNPGSSTWNLAQDYSSSSAFAWSTTSLPMGTYGLAVWVREQGSSAAYEAYTSMTYTLATPVCSGASLGASPGSPSQTGVPVTFTAGATGCGQPQFRFFLQNPGSSTWNIVQDYGSSPTWSWAAPGPPGTYGVAVWVRQQGSSAAWEAYTSLYFTLTAPACSSVMLSANPASPQAHGTPIQFTAAAAGCNQAVYKFWLQAPGSTSWSMAQDWSSSAQFNWTTTALAPGTYRVAVWARNQWSSATWETYTSVSFVLT